MHMDFVYFTRVDVVFRKDYCPLLIFSNGNAVYCIISNKLKFVNLFFSSKETGPKTQTCHLVALSSLFFSVPEDYKVNPGPVEAIAEHPTEPDKILIGYQRGLIVLWDKKNLCADQVCDLFSH